MLFSRELQGCVDQLRIFDTEERDLHARAHRSFVVAGHLEIKRVACEPCCGATPHELGPPRFPRGQHEAGARAFFQGVVERERGVVSIGAGRLERGDRGGGWEMGWN